MLRHRSKPSTPNSLPVIVRYDTKIVKWFPFLGGLSQDKTIFHGSLPFISAWTPYFGCPKTGLQVSRPSAYPLPTFGNEKCLSKLGMQHRPRMCKFRRTKTHHTSRVDQLHLGFPVHMRNGPFGAASFACCYSPVFSVFCFPPGSVSFFWAGLGSRVSSISLTNESGYGYVTTIPAFYGLWWITPELLNGYMQMSFREERAVRSCFRPWANFPSRSGP